MADYAGAMAAIEARLTTLWAETPVAFENEREPDVIGEDGLLQPWVYCEILTDRSRIRSVGRPGDHVNVLDGTIVLTLFVRRNSGREEARGMASRLAEIFRTQVFHQVADGVYVRTWTPEIGPGNPANSENPTGSWWAISILTPFEFFHRA